MSIIVRELRNRVGNRSMAILEHHQQKILAYVYGTIDQLERHVGNACIVEMDFKNLLSWKSLAEFDDQDSRIVGLGGEDASARIIGRAYSVIELDNAKMLVDIYLRNGPEFIAAEISVSDGIQPSVGSGIEIEVTGLCFYPSNT
jgi:hypothetical protein